MRAVCLTLPTNRECAATIAAIGAEAAYAARRFGVRVHLLILDSADPAAFERHAEAVAALSAVALPAAGQMAAGRWTPGRWSPGRWTPGRWSSTTSTRPPSAPSCAT